MNPHDEVMCRLADELGETWKHNIRRGYRKDIRRFAEDYDRAKIYRWVRVPPAVERISHPKARCLAFIRLLAGRLHYLKARHGDCLPPDFNPCAQEIQDHRIWIQGELNMLKILAEAEPVI